MQIPNTTLDDICALIGMNATLHLVVWFGGQGIYIPEVANENSLLVRLIGLSNAQKLSKEWPCERLHIPTFRAYEDLQKRKSIGRQFEMGFSSTEIANSFRMTERRVQQICRELEVAGLIDIVGPPTRKKAAAAFNGVRAKQKKGDANSKVHRISWPSSITYKIKP
jgi:hypothetical protein